MARDAPSSEVQRALRELDTIAGDNVLVTHHGEGQHKVHFDYGLRQMDLPQMTGAGSGGLTVQVGTLRDGQGATQLGQFENGNTKLIIGGTGVRGDTDLMAGGLNDTAGSLAVRQGLSLEGLKMALHLEYSKEEAQLWAGVLSSYLMVLSSGDTKKNKWDADERPPVDADEDLGRLSLPGRRLLIRDKDENLPAARILDFGSVDLEGDPVVRTLQLASVGSTRIAFREVSIQGGDGSFSLDPDPGKVALRNGETVDVRIRFEPSRVGEKRATLVLDAGRPLGRLETQLIGLGTSHRPALRVKIESTNIGGDELDGEAKAMPNFGALENAGGAPLRIGKLEWSGPAAGQFGVRVAGGLPQVLAPGDRVALGLSFDAARRGLQAATLNVHSNDPLDPVTGISVVGTGLGDSSWGNDYVAIELRQPRRLHVVRFLSDKFGRFQRPLSADTGFHAMIFDAKSGLIAHSHGTTAPDGERTHFTRLLFEASEAPDRDGDFLPDDVELALGTSPDSGDSDGDGISDFEWMQRQAQSLSR